MVDVIKTLDIKYLPCNPASSFRALHESLIDYGGNKQPEFLTCMHEESAVGMAHGYFKIAGKPLLTLVPRHRRPAARGDGHLQCLVRPRAGDRRRRQRNGRRASPAGRADLPFGAGHQRAGARLHQMGRHAGVAAAFRAVVRAHVQDRDDAALWAGDDVARRGLAAGADPRRRRETLHSAFRAKFAAAGRQRRGERSGTASRQCGASGHRRRPRRADAERHQAARRTRRKPCRRRSSTWAVA